MYTLAELGTRQFFSLKTTRQRNKALETRKTWKNIKASVSEWRSPNQTRHNAIIDNFVGLKTLLRSSGSVVARPAPHIGSRTRIDACVGPRLLFLVIRV